MPDKIILEYDNNNEKEKVVFEKSGILIDLYTSSDNLYNEIIEDCKKDIDYIKWFYDDSILEINNVEFKNKYNERVSELVFIEKYTHNGFDFRAQNHLGEYELIIFLNNELTVQDIKELIKDKGSIDNHFIENDYILIYIKPSYFEDITDTFKDNNIKFEENFKSIKYIPPRLQARINSYVEEKEIPLSPAFDLINYSEEIQNIIRKKEVIIGLMDNGVQGDHPDLIDIFDNNKSLNFFTNQPNQTPVTNEKHGTNCAGILAGFPKNKKGIIGTGSGSTLISYKIANGDGNDYNDCHISNFLLIQAFKKAVKDNCSVINCSWSLPYTSPFLKDTIIKTVLEGRNGKGLPVVFAAGNAGKEITFPANLPEVITVSASDLQKRPFSKDYSNDSWSSNYGKNILMGAPGIDIYTTDLVDGLGETPIIINGDKYPNHSLFKGTSAAAPIIAGFIARLLIYDLDLCLCQIKNIISNSIIPFQQHLEDERNFGSGIISYNELKNKINQLNT